jgi:tRNA-dihydrouridine synthase
MLATGCAGVMIGRAGVGQPWLIAKLIAEYNNEKEIPSPTNQEICAALLEHVSRLTVLLQSEKFAILQARKFAKYYARTLSSRAEFKEAVNNCEDLHAFTEICQQHFAGV